MITECPMMLQRSISVWDYLTGSRTTLAVINILLLIRPGNCDTCSVGQVIRATLSDASMMWTKLGCVDQAFPLGPQHTQLCIGASRSWKIPCDSDGIWTQGLPTCSLKHYATGAGAVLKFRTDQTAVCPNLHQLTYLRLEQVVTWLYSVLYTTASKFQKQSSWSEPETSFKNDNKVRQKNTIHKWCPTTPV